MTGKVLVVAALLLTSLCKVAAAAESSEHPPKNAHKVIVVLGSLGINDSDIQEFVTDMSSRVDDGYFTLAERRVPGGKLKLQYQLERRPDRPLDMGDRDIELKYTPDDSNFEAVARPDSFMVNYRLKF